MRNYFLTLALVSIIMGCFKERIELDYNIDDQKKIAVSGWINTLSEPQFISIGYTANYLGVEEQEPITNAVVILSDESQQYEMQEQAPGKYYLPSTWVPRVGDVYQLEIEIAGQTYRAQHKMHANPDILNLHYQRAEFMAEDTAIYYQSVFDFQEIPGEGDAYYAVDYKKGSLSRDSITNGGYADDRFIDGQYFENIVVTEDERLFRYGDTIVIEMHSIGLETALYLQDIENEIYRGSPFDTPPANVRTNLSGGAIGYFIVSEAKTDTIIVLP